MRRTSSLALLAGLVLACGAATAEPRDQERSQSSNGPAEASCNRRDYRVLLDVGHTVEVPGATSARSVPEYEFNLRLAQRIETSLVEAGFGKTLLLVTRGPAFAGLVARVARANAWPADVFLSIHHDSVPEWFLEAWEVGGKLEGYSDRFSGHSLFVSAQNPKPQASLAFAKLIGRELKAEGLRHTPHYTQAEMRGRRRALLDPEVGVYRYDQLIVLRNTKMPAVLLEAGSIVNRDEELVMATDQRKAVIAAAVTRAVERFCASAGRPSRALHSDPPGTIDPG